jgi:hypothetical protein
MRYMQLKAAVLAIGLASGAAWAQSPPTIPGGPYGDNDRRCARMSS